MKRASLFPLGFYFPVKGVGKLVVSGWYLTGEVENRHTEAVSGKGF